ncbi:MAG: GGDEF domain-containing protein [Eubacterium sp.]|nr:GGDEF domain-containing protein [Eubacterium sp.]
MSIGKIRVLHYIISIAIIIISLACEAWAIYRLSLGARNEAMVFFAISAIIFVGLLVALYIENHRTSVKSINEKKESITLSRIALSLASDYESVYYVNSENDHYVEYGVENDENESLDIISEGDDFYGDSIVNAKKIVHKDDRDAFLSIINKDRIKKAFENHETLRLDYRLIINGEVMHYSLKVAQGFGPDDKYVVIGVRNVENAVRTAEKLKQTEEESVTFGRISQALASRYEVLYYIDLNTNEYHEFSTSEAYSHLKVGEFGRDFFEDSQKNMKISIYPEDYEMMAEKMNKEVFLDALEGNGIYTLRYRLMLDGEPEYVELRAMKPKGDENHVVLGVMNIHEATKREEEYRKRIDDAMILANRDGLTGVKNKNAYASMEADMNKKIMAGGNNRFAVVICDVNNLKRINDSAGHKTGDDAIREACMMVCRVFKHSPVYRVGGDEFAVILRGEDYENRTALMQQLSDQNEINSEENKVTIACGISDYIFGQDKSLADVFERADDHMYLNKKELKK